MAVGGSPPTRQRLPVVSARGRWCGQCPIARLTCSYLSRTHLPGCDHAARCRSAGSPTSTGLSSPIDALSSRTDRPSSTVIVRSASPARRSAFGPLRRVHGARSTLRLPTRQPAFPICALFAQNRLRIQRRPACCLPHRLLRHRRLLIETCHSGLSRNPTSRAVTTDDLELLYVPQIDSRSAVRHTFCISGEDGWCLDVVGVRTVVGKAQPFAARHARGSE
jgi:hypothetical protein